MAVKLVEQFVNSRQELCVTLSDGVRAVHCEDVLYVDFVDQEAIDLTFEEWCELADSGEDGYYYVKA